MISKIIIESFIQLAKDKDIDRKELADIIKETHSEFLQILNDLSEKYL